MITLPSHTSHALQPLIVSCFKAFKTTSKKVKDATMSRSNHMQLDKIALARWVDQALKQSFRKQKIKSRFRNTCIWPLNPKAMDSKIKTLEVYTPTHMSNAMSEEDYTIRRKLKIILNGGRIIATKILHIAKIDQHPRFEDLPIYMSQNV